MIALGHRLWKRRLDKTGSAVDRYHTAIGYLNSVIQSHSPDDDMDLAREIASDMITALAGDMDHMIRAEKQELSKVIFDEVNGFLGC